MKDEIGALVKSIIKKLNSGEICVVRTNETLKLSICINGNGQWICRHDPTGLCDIPRNQSLERIAIDYVVIAEMVSYDERKGDADFVHFENRVSQFTANNIEVILESLAQDLKVALQKLDNCSS